MAIWGTKAHDVIMGTPPRALTKQPLSLAMAPQLSSIECPCLLQHNLNLISSQLALSGPTGLSGSNNRLLSGGGAPTRRRRSKTSSRSFVSIVEGIHYC